MSLLDFSFFLYVLSNPTDQAKFRYHYFFEESFVNLQDQKHLIFTFICVVCSPLSFLGSLHFTFSFKMFVCLVIMTFHISPLKQSSFFSYNKSFSSLSSSSSESSSFSWNFDCEIVFLALELLCLLHHSFTLPFYAKACSLLSSYFFFMEK